jgi:hypothetical protein
LEYIFLFPKATKETQRLYLARTRPRSMVVAWRGRDNSSIQGGGWWAVARDLGDEGIWGGVSTGELVEMKELGSFGEGRKKMNELFLCNEWHMWVVSPQLHKEVQYICL